MTRDPLIDKLAHFNPVSSTIDRDAMLFAAGRASASRSRGWIALASMLACSQVATLAFLITSVRNGQIPSPNGLSVAQMPFESSADQPSAQQLAADSYGQLMRQWEENGLPLPKPIMDPVPAQAIYSANLNSLERLF
jgi:hypothetical protein